MCGPIRNSNDVWGVSGLVTSMKILIGCKPSPYREEERPYIKISIISLLRHDSSNQCSGDLGEAFLFFILVSIATL